MRTAIICGALMAAAALSGCLPRMLDRASCRRCASSAISHVLGAFHLCMRANGWVSIRETAPSIAAPDRKQASVEPRTGERKI
jgi:hypothetical protein